MEKKSSPASPPTPEPTPTPTTSSPSSSSGSNNWLYILGGCCCLLLLGLIIAAVVAVYYFSANSSSISKEWQNFDSSLSNDLSNTDTSYNNLFSDLETDNTNSDNLDTKTEVKGTIEGSLSYPGEKIPADLKVCAENIFYSDQTYCADKLINDAKYTNSTGYNIEAPVGSYYVYSYLPAKPDEKAFYTDFVDCGLKAECTSHDKLIIDVYPDETTDQVDPIDWYKQ